MLIACSGLWCNYKAPDIQFYSLTQCQRQGAIITGMALGELPATSAGRIELTCISPDGVKQTQRNRWNNHRPVASGGNIPLG